MTNKINSKTVLFVALAIVLVFGAISIMPEKASAYYGYYGSPFGSYIGSQYGYGSTYVSPVVIPQPVYVQQPVIVQQPIVVQQPVVYPVVPPLAVSCSASVTYNSNYSIAAIVWTANPSGGNGYYSYSWTGTDGLTGSSKSVYYNYSIPGPKYASVTVHSAGQSITRSCAPVTVSQPYYPVQPVIYQPSPTYVAPAPLNVACYVDPTNAKTNQPINWTAEVTGGVAPYTYSWTGSDNLTGSQSSIIKYYSKTGSKSAIVTVTSADGRTGVKACSNAINITSSYVAPVKKTVAKEPAKVVVVEKPVVVEPTNSNNTANSLFSLQNVPWGWVAILIILILFFTVMYLIFNRKKI